jgi:lysophospholipase L1-like esterase
VSGKCLRPGDVVSLMRTAALLALTVACAATAATPVTRAPRAEAPPRPTTAVAAPTIAPTAPAASIAPPPAPTGPLVTFYRVLREVESGGGGAVVRIVQLGDSHTEDGRFVARVQQRLRERFGEAITVEGIGVIGAHAAQLAARDWATFGPELAQRAPALVVLQYGTNEAASRHADPRSLEETLVALAARVREHVPGCAVLVLGPPDLARRHGDAWVTPPTLAPIIAAEQRAAARADAGFFDAREALRPEGSIDALTRTQPRLAYPDHIHLTPRGYALLADRYVDALLAGYDRWRAPPP